MWNSPLDPQPAAWVFRGQSRANSLWAIYAGQRSPEEILIIYSDACGKSISLLSTMILSSRDVHFDRPQRKKHKFCAHVFPNRTNHFTKQIVTPLPRYKILQGTVVIVNHQTKFCARQHVPHSSQTSQIESLVKRHFTMPGQDVFWVSLKKFESHNSWSNSGDISQSVPLQSVFKTRSIT